MKKEASTGATVLITRPLPSTNRGGRGPVGSASAARPSRKEATEVPWPPGVQGVILSCSRIRRAAGAGSPSSRKQRPSSHTRLVRTRCTDTPPSGSGPSYPGPANRYRPPWPRSGPGTSTTSGPAERSRKVKK
ncbi:hypothetical protein GCM10025734_28510 [Kitasatospora paranensis]